MNTSADLMRDEAFMQEALRLARSGIEQRHGGPFGALVVIGDEIVGRGWNQVVFRNDPTAHAEILAIREACSRRHHFHLEDATLYSTCEPCPMCLAAIHWARIETVVYAADAADAARLGFQDEAIRLALRESMAKSSITVRRLLQDSALEVFERWRNDQGKVPY